MKKILLMIGLLTFFLSSCVSTYEVTVNFDSNGGSLVPSQVFNEEITFILPNNPMKEGFTFNGWYLDETLEMPFSVESILTLEPEGTIILFASWKINQYTITFDTDGGSPVSAITQDYDTTVSAPIEPTKEGYTFGGWSETVPTTMPATNITLTARWTINQYTITFDTDGGSTISAITQDYNSQILVPTNPIKEGHTFIGWSDMVPSMMPSEDLLISAQWMINEYTINYYVYDNDESLNNILLEDGETIVSIVLEGNHSSALTSTGRVFMWGYNYYGQLGDGTTIDRTTPTEITSQFNLSGGETIMSLSLGFGHSSALTSTGRVFIWGANSFGQLGDGTTSNRTTPTEITSQFNLNDGETVVSLSLDYGHSSALTSTGRVFMWGWNAYGQLGDDTFTRKTIPTEITTQFNLNDGETVVSLSLGGSHSSALTSLGRVFTWGENFYNQLGDGTITNRTIPTEITPRFNLSDGETIIHISLGDRHASALTSTGRVFMWGWNVFGQLGDNTTIDQSTPAEITSEFGLTAGETVISISLGEFHSSALTSTGRIFTWGRNLYGQLGDGTTTNQSSPKAITSEFDLTSGELIVSIVAGDGHTSIFTSTGRLFFWGENYYGQLGDGTTVDSITPIEMQSYMAFSTLETVQDFNETLEAYMPLREGYLFDGWYVDQNLTTKYTFTSMPAEDLILYGRWIALENEVVYMTLDELSAFDGKDGANAYIAYNGVIYDVTNNPNWPNGVHRGYINAGQDVTALFQTAGSTHNDSNITNLPIIGYLVEE